MTREVPTPKLSTGADARAAMVYSSRSLVRTILVLVAPSRSNCCLTSVAVSAKSPESIRTAATFPLVIFTARSTAFLMS